MSGPVVGADPQALRDLQADVSALADAVDAIQTRLTRVLTAEGRCWGTDEAGATFEASYLPASRTVRSLLAGTESGIAEIAAAFGAAIAIFEAAEADAGRAMR
jgi:hypothetical protein